MKAVKKHVRLALGFPVLAAMLSLAACAHSIAPSSISSSEAATAAAALVTTGAWRLQSITRPDSTVVSISEPDRFTVQFTDGNRLSLRADCNKGFGGFSSNGNSINVGPVGITKAYCVETAPLDDEYVSLLNGDNTVTLTATSLQLSSARGTLRFIQ
jgi:heat shock protein HslJ